MIFTISQLLGSIVCRLFSDTALLLLFKTSFQYTEDNWIFAYTLYIYGLFHLRFNVCSSLHLNLVFCNYILVYTLRISYYVRKHSRLLILCLLIQRISRFYEVCVNSTKENVIIFVIFLDLIEVQIGYAGTIKSLTDRLIRPGYLTVSEKIKAMKT